MSDDIVRKEKQFIRLLLKNKELVSDYMESFLVDNHFHSEHQTILKAIEDAFDKDVLLTRGAYEAFVKKLRSPKERAFEAVIYNACLSAIASKDDFPLLMNEIIESFLFRATNDKIHNFRQVCSDKGTMFAVKNLADGLQNISVDTISNERMSYYDNFGPLSREHFIYKEKIRTGELKVPPRILTGIKEIDDTMGTGLAAGTLMLVCADVGGFKSVMMMNIGLNVWAAGYNVLFVPIEMAKEQCFERIWSRQSRVPSEKIQKVSYSVEESEKIKKVIKEFEDSEKQFYVMQMPGATTVKIIERQIDKHIDLFRPSLVVIDYIDNLEADKRNERHDLEISDMLQKLRTMGRDRGFAVLSGAQLGRDALKRIRKAGATKNGTAINSEDIRGAHSFSMDADYILAQILNSAQPESLLDIYVVKARNGKKIFSCGNFRASLEVCPEIQLIRSVSDFDMTDDGVLEKLEMYSDIEKDVPKVSTGDVFDEMMGESSPSIINPDNFDF